MADICDTCAFEDACPSAHSHTTGNNTCADYKTMLKKVQTMDNLKPCPFCGCKPVNSVMTSFGGSIYIATIKCEKCGRTKQMAYSPGSVNKPKNAVATALRLAKKEWNRQAREEGADNG